MTFNTQAADVIDHVYAQHGKVNVALVEEHCATNMIHQDVTDAAKDYALDEEIDALADYYAPVQASEFDK